MNLSSRVERELRSGLEVESNVNCLHRILDRSTNPTHRCCCNRCCNRSRRRHLMSWSIDRWSCYNRRRDQGPKTPSKLVDLVLCPLLSPFFNYASFNCIEPTEGCGRLRHTPQAARSLKPTFGVGAQRPSKNSAASAVRRATRMHLTLM